jgi:hypothetical protein
MVIMPSQQVLFYIGRRLPGNENLCSGDTIAGSLYVSFDGSIFIYNNYLYKYRLLLYRG